jgi:phenylalanyl-tRNA synthetase beta chain
MKIPLSWLQEFVAIPAKINAEQISQAFVKVGFEVEGIEEQGADLKGPIVVGKVL